MKGGLRALVLLLLVLGVSSWIATAGAAGLGWGLQRTPDPGAGQSDLSGVSCTAPSACTAVGYHHNSSLAERWNGKKWAIQRTPNPAGAANSRFSGVSCWTAHACIAVGYYTNSAGRELTLAERWNGKKWAIQRTPNPAGGTGSGLGAGSRLSGVSCTAARACTAVGLHYVSASQFDVALVERWNGKKWAIQRTPNPAGATQIRLDGVSCTAARACTAVGLHDYGAGPGLFVPLAERWNGKTWTIQRTPGAAQSYFGGVSCTAARACIAVGRVSTNVPGHPATLAERWNGTKWAIQRTPTPAGSANSDFSGVSCTTARACTAVGSDYYTNGAGQKLTLAERWNGKKWTIQRTPNPAATTYSFLRAVSCTTRRACIAVGAYENAPNQDVTLAERHS